MCNGRFPRPKIIKACSVTSNRRQINKLRRTRNSPQSMLRNSAGCYCKVSSVLLEILYRFYVSLNDSLIFIKKRSVEVAHNNYILKFFHWFSFLNSSHSLTKYSGNGALNTISSLVLGCVSLSSAANRH